MSTLSDDMASIPFRFKAGGSATPMTEQHSHRSTTKASQKPFKSRHATKGAIKELTKGIDTQTYERLDSGLRNHRQT